MLNNTFLSMKLLFVMLFLLFFNCTRKSDELVIYISEDVVCGFVFDNQMHFYFPWGSYEKTSIFDLTEDSLVLYNEIAFKRLIVPKERLQTDTVLMANIHTDLRRGEGVIFNAIVKGNSWEVGIYYPYNKKGSYKFNVTDEIALLFYSLVHQTKLNSNVIFPDQNIIDSLNSDENNRIAEFYFGVKENYKIKCTYCIFPYCCNFVNSLNQLSSIVILNHITPENKVSNKIFHLEVRQMFNNYSLLTNWENNMIFNIDSIYKQLENSKNQTN